MAPRSSENGLVYLPILREGRNERHVMDEFAGLARFDELREGKLLYPLVEITESHKMANLDEYRQAADKLFIEVPEYLAEEEGHALRDEIGELLEDYDGQNEFYREHEADIDTPVISGHPSQDLLDSYERAKDQFPDVALRLLLSDSPENGELKRANDIGQEINGSDLVIFDLLNDSYEEDEGYAHLDALADIFSENRLVVANAINIYDGEAYNWGPELANEYGLDGFGDFAVGGRYPPIIPNLHENRVRFRQYKPGDFEMKIFDGETHEEAVQRLEAWERWREDHCPFCRELGERDKECTAHMAKKARVGHYIHTVLQNDLDWLADQRT